MYPLPILALGVIASGYGYATVEMNARAADAPAPGIQAYPARSGSDDLAVYDMPGMAPFDITSPYCETAPTLAATLKHDFEEVPVDTSTQGDGLTMVLFASEVMGTWTLVHQGDDGMSCIVSSGTGWTASAQPEDVLAAVPVAGS
ncbi:MAG: hypothetical protein R3D63_14970 [Paracoccaceae bacterium]